MNTNALKERLRVYLAGFDRKKLIVFLGIAGMLLILLSELMPDKKQEKSNEPAASDDISSDMYKQQLEKELCDILSKIDGVGETKVMLTLDGTTEYIYAQNLDTTIDTDESSKRESSRNEIVITESGGDKKALVKKIIRPQVTGVLIACTGGDDIHNREKIIGAASAVLGIPASRVYVAGLKE